MTKEEKLREIQNSSSGHRKTLDLEEKKNILVKIYKKCLNKRLISVFQLKSERSTFEAWKLASLIHQ